MGPSPLLLLRRGVTGGANIGRRLVPSLAVLVLGFFPFLVLRFAVLVVHLGLGDVKWCVLVVDSPLRSVVGAVSALPCSLPSSPHGVCHDGLRALDRSLPLGPEHLELRIQLLVLCNLLVEKYFQALVFDVLLLQLKLVLFGLLLALGPFLLGTFLQFPAVFSQGLYQVFEVRHDVLLLPFGPGCQSRRRLVPCVEGRQRRIIREGQVPVVSKTTLAHRGWHRQLQRLVKILLRRSQPLPGVHELHLQLFQHTLLIL
mmetsp:Transcript_14252/g.26130  ORF Transcript_14252/g.26130 Transcript_14252/m.26130 type:complete len:257 (+) Transcript_14252:274-1044(+)